LQQLVKKQGKGVGRPYTRRMIERLADAWEVAAEMLVCFA
jgi:hypothetical protein